LRIWVLLMGLGCLWYMGVWEQWQDMRAVMHVLDRKVVSSHGRFNVVWAGLNLAV
jgi:hypothetical protein